MSTEREQDLYAVPVQVLLDKMKVQHALLTRVMESWVIFPTGSAVVGDTREWKQLLQDISAYFGK